MYKSIRFLFVLILLFGLNSCSKEEYVNVLQDKYEPTIREPEFAGEDFIVNLNARPLQPGEHGEWAVAKGEVAVGFVYFEDKTNPFTRFKGMPGEEYTLEWKHTAADEKISIVQTKVKIPELNIEIKDETPAEFETIRFLSVNPKYRGVWSFEGAYAYLNSKYHDGLAEPSEKKPSIELHAYANTSYTAIYSYTYGGKVYKFQKVIKTGNYTQDEGLYELQLSRGTYRVIEDKLGNVLELNLQAAGIAWILTEKSYPALQAFKKLRKIILGGSSLRQIPTLFGDHYHDLEEINIDMAAGNPIFPENFGNLTKLKTLIFRPMNHLDPRNEVMLPKSFAKLTALEHLSILWSGYVNFNGTLGSLVSLKTLNTKVESIPDDIGNLKELEHLDLYCEYPTFPQRFSECRSLKFIRIRYSESSGGNLVLSSKIGNLKKLETLEIDGTKIQGLPDTFAELSALKALSLNSLQSIPENFGNLSNLENLTLYGAFTKVPNSFGNLDKLIYLTMAGKMQSLPESFGNLSSLIYFNGEYSEYKTLPNSFGRLKKLKELKLSQSKIETLPESFGELDALEKLNLATTQFKTFPKAIIPLKSIRDVVFSNVNVGDIPDDISRMKGGIVFGLYNIPNLTLDHLKHVVSITKNQVFNTSFGYFSSWTY